ncbi:hypothetical protein CEXT_745991 [Caerostris extrusa]|uniref:Uncharacterized protein n=1 Tax=Caerostris extrusa TaxID=172846 RepID=A0AAV4VVJ1_CAEEX|nr:hypothetical protein CEXT_745991 [Caerostris extrusa]
MAVLCSNNAERSSSGMRKRPCVKCASSEDQERETRDYVRHTGTILLRITKFTCENPMLQRSAPSGFQHNRQRTLITDHPLRLGNNRNQEKLPPHRQEN